MRSAPVVRGDDQPSSAGEVFANRRVGPANGGRREAITHDFAAVAFYIAGGVRIQQRQVWTLDAGDALIVPPGEPHRLVSSHNPEMWCLGFCVPCVAADMAPGFFEIFERVRDGVSPVVRIPEGRHAFLLSLFQELNRTTLGDVGGAVVRRSLLTLMLHEVASAVGPAPTAARGSVVHEALRFIERHCLERLTLDDVAGAVNRTPSYITTALKRATGRSAVAWMTAGRMAEARRRLRHSDEQVDVIAERVGYADPTHFIRMFRRAHGVTPARWRMLQRRASYASAPEPTSSSVSG
jgi:AraC family transcriptional regulator, transcriptional activator of pobA